MEFVITAAACALVFFFWITISVVKKHRKLKRRSSELPPLAAQQLDAFHHSFNKAYALGLDREAKIYKAKELAVFATGFPIGGIKSGIPLLCTSGYIESLTDEELDETLTSLEAMTRD
jgi:hypothetical protein